VTISLKRLASQYDQLTPRERFSLIVAAGVRGDDSEQDLLKRSGPTQLFRVPSYRGYAEAFSDAACLYLLQQLDTGVQCWKCLALLETAETKSERLWNCVGLFGHLFVARRQAWHRLCEGYGVDGDAILSIFPGFDVVQDLDEMISELAFTPEQATVILRERDESLRAASHEDIYEAMRQSIEEQAACWA
jgi:hypothetical protein